MLYPIVVSPDPQNEFEQVYEIEPQRIFVFPFSLAEGQTVDHRTIQVGDKQDSSMKCWISDTPGGNPVYSVPYMFLEWHPLSVFRQDAEDIDALANTLSVCEVNAPVPDNRFYMIPVRAGNYYFNVMNLVNSLNQFVYVQTLTNPE